MAFSDRKTIAELTAKMLLEVEAVRFSRCPGSWRLTAGRSVVGMDNCESGETRLA